MKAGWIDTFVIIVNANMYALSVGMNAHFPLHACSDKFLNAKHLLAMVRNHSSLTIINAG
jgi:hypothetical protein